MFWLAAMFFLNVCDCSRCSPSAFGSASLYWIWRFLAFAEVRQAWSTSITIHQASSSHFGSEAWASLQSQSFRPFTTTGSSSLLIFLKRRRELRSEKRRIFCPQFSVLLEPNRFCFESGRSTALTVNLSMNFPARHVPTILQPRTSNFSGSCVTMTCTRSFPTYTI